MANEDYNWILTEKIRVTLVGCYLDRKYTEARVYLVDELSAFPGQGRQYATLSTSASSSRVLTNGREIEYDEQIWGFMDELDVRLGDRIGETIEVKPYSDGYTGTETLRGQAE